MNDMEVDFAYAMPGGDNFEDVTGLFVVAAKGTFLTFVQPGMAHQTAPKTWRPRSC